uniref:Class S F-box protein n=3 Tax=Solanum tuberosum TaxID=4113 RepID=M1AGY5_SOLTU
MKKLPQDVMIYIFLRFSVKSLLRFKLISKTWYTLIQSSTFINIHLNGTTIPKKEFIVCSHSIKKETEGFKNVLSILYSDDHDNINIILPDLDLPYLSFTPFYHFNELVGTCNGLIVLTDNEDIVLFNPATKTYMLLPPSPFVCQKGFNRNFIGGVGFGFDPIINDYKFVRISEVFLDSYWCPEEKVQKVEVYDMCIDSWRDLNHIDQQLPNVHSYPCFEKLHRGTFHWYATSDLMDVILCFDIRTEIFRNMKMPDSSNYFDEMSYSLTVMTEFLTLICYHGPDSEINPIRDTMDIWIMIEYGVHESWTKKHIIKPLPIEYPLTILRDYLLLLQKKSGLLIWYNLNSNEVRELDFLAYPRSLSVIGYQESLISIPKRGP